MRFNVIINPEAINDIEILAEWYESKAKGLGTKFYKDVKKNIKLLHRNANSFAIRYNNVHCINIKKFPCLIHYRIIETTVIIYGIIHTSQNPEIWEERAK